MIHAQIWWLRNSLRTHHSHHFSSRKRLFEPASSFQALVKLSNELNITRIILCSGVVLFLNRIVRCRRITASLGRFSLGTVGNESCHERLSHLIETVISTSLFLVTDRGNDILTDLSRCVHKEMPDYGYVLGGNSVPKHLSELFNIQRRSLERLWTTIERHVK